MLRRFSTARVVALGLIDWLGTLAMLGLALHLRAYVDISVVLPSLEAGWPGAATALRGPVSPQVGGLVALIWPATFVGLSIYDGRRNPTLGAELRNVTLAVAVSTLVLSGVLFFTYRQTSRVLIVLFVALDMVLVLGSRGALWAYRRVQDHRPSARCRGVLLVGAGSVGVQAAEQLQKYAWSNIELVGYVDDDPQKQHSHFAGLPVLGTLDELPRLVGSFDVQDALVTLPLRAHERLVSVCRTLQDAGVHVHVVPDLFALSFPNAALEGFGGIPVIDLGQPGLQGWPRLSKRAFDVAAASLLLILLSPLLGIVALLIKLESPGPVIYRQERIGENGEPFTMLKFRSMRNDVASFVHRAHVARLIKENISPEEQTANGGSLKLADDPRITRVGRLIRKTSIDELPQLVNVLRGEMSLVGPRPPLPYEVALYDDWHKQRLQAIPGITGWWQVKGRNRVSFDEMVRMDLDYIEHSSLWLDLKILFLTPWAVISGKGAG